MPEESLRVNIVNHGIIQLQGFLDPGVLLVDEGGNQQSVVRVRVDFNLGFSQVILADYLNSTGPAE